MHRRLNLLDYSLRARRLVMRRPADAYHALNLDTLPVAVAAARRSHAPVVYDARELYYDRAVIPSLEKRLWWLIERMLIKRVDQVIAPCESFAEELVRRHGIVKPAVVMSCPERPSQIPSGAVARLRNKAALQDTDEPIILYQGRIQADRGLAQLVHAAGQLTKGVVVIMGEGNAKTMLQQMVAEAGLSERVRILDAVPSDELLSYTAGASIGVAPIEGNHLSYYYSAPNKLFEYLAAGLPVVASRLPEMERVIEQHEVGLLSEPGDTDGLASALNRLLGDETLRERLSRNAREAAKIYTWEYESRKLVSLYERLDVLAS